MNEKREVTSVVPRKLRGTLTILENDDMEFRAQRSTGEANQIEKSRYKSSKIYETVGEKKSNTVAHIVIPKDSVDPVGDIYEQLEHLTKGMDVKKKISAPRGKRLCDEKDCVVTLNKEKKRVEVRIDIDLAEYPNYQSRLMELMYKLNQCFAINQTSLASVR